MKTSKEVDKVGYWKGESISGMSREKLLQVITEMGNYYESRLKENENDNIKI